MIKFILNFLFGGFNARENASLMNKSDKLNYYSNLSYSRYRRNYSYALYLFFYCIIFTSFCLISFFLFLFNVLSFSVFFIDFFIYWFVVFYILSVYWIDIFLFRSNRYRDYAFRFNLLWGRYNRGLELDYVESMRIGSVDFFINDFEANELSSFGIFDYLYAFNNKGKSFFNSFF